MSLFSDLILAKKGDGIRVIIAGFVFGSFMIWDGFKRFLRKQKIENTPTSKIMHAAQGLCEIQAYAWPTIPMYASNGKFVVYHYLKIEEYQRSGKNSEWVTVFEEKSSTPFIATDATGVCRIHPHEKAEIDTAKKVAKLNELTEFQRMNLISIYPAASSYLTRLGTGILSSLISKPIRITEGAIFIGSPIYVRGCFQTLSQNQCNVLAGLNQFCSELENANKKSLKKNWTYFANELLKHEELESINITGELLGDTEHGMILADAHQAQLLHRIGDRYFWMLLGGAALIALAIYFLISYHDLL